MQAEQSRQTENLIRIGTIVEVDHSALRCRAKTGGNTTNWLAWIEACAGNVTTWNPPSVGEQCLILSPSGEMANGLVLTGINSDTKQPPSKNPNNFAIKMPDGASFNYDHSAGTLSIANIKKLTVQASEKITLDCPSVEITGDATINGIQFGQHIHTGDDGGNTSAPTGNAS